VIGGRGRQGWCLAPWLVRSGPTGGPALGVGRLVVREHGALDRGRGLVACRRRRFDFHGVGKDRVQEMSFARVSRLWNRVKIRSTH
jgi:hypothetical protein